MPPTKKDNGAGAFPPVASDIRELLAATDDGVDVPAEPDHDPPLPAVRLSAPTLEALRPVFAHLDVEKGEVTEPSGNGAAPRPRIGTLLAKELSLRISVLRAVMPGLREDGRATALARKLGTDSKIIRAAFDLCLLPPSLLDRDAPEPGGDGDAPEAAFAARPTR